MGKLKNKKGNLSIVTPVIIITKVNKIQRDKRVFKASLLSLIKELWAYEKPDKRDIQTMLL